VRTDNGEERHIRDFGRSPRELEQRIRARTGMADTVVSGWEWGRREALGTFGPDRGPRLRVSRD
jgi:hypothetical protein